MKVMNTSEASVVERAEQVKWWDALDVLCSRHFARGLEMARQCLHPDAQWLCSLFRAGVEVTRERMREVMLQQGDDPRALFFACCDGPLQGNVLTRAAETGARLHGNVLRRPAEMGYAPAQGRLATLCRGEEAFPWAASGGAGRSNRDLHAGLLPSLRTRLRSGHGESDRAVQSSC
jgi:hypothetical protein